MHTGDVSCSREVEEEEEVAMGPLLISLLCSLFLKRRKASSRPHAVFSFHSLGGVEEPIHLYIVCTYVGKDGNRGR